MRSGTECAAEGSVEHCVECLRRVEFDGSECVEALDGANRVNAVEYLMSDHVGSVVAATAILTLPTKPMWAATGPRAPGRSRNR
jgi:hypothetical protein